MTKLIQSKHWTRGKPNTSLKIKIAKSKKKTFVSRAKARAVKGK